MNYESDADIDPVEPGMASPQHGNQGDRLAPPPQWLPAAPTIAVSRESGGRGTSIARRVGAELGWQVYTQELLEYTAQDERVRQELWQGLTDEARDWVESRLRELPIWHNRHQDPFTAELMRTVLTLGAQGEAVIIGRGAGHVLPRRSTLHIRFVALYAERVAYMAQWLRLTREEAARQVEERDRRREQFLKSVLGRDPHDVHHYDLVVNTSYIGEELSAALIIEAARAKWTALTEGNDAGRS